MLCCPTPAAMRSRLQTLSPGAKLSWQSDRVRKSCRSLALGRSAARRTREAYAPTRHRPCERVDRSCWCGCRHRFIGDHFSLDCGLRTVAHHREARRQALAVATSGLAVRTACPMICAIVSNGFGTGCQEARILARTFSTSSLRDRRLERFFLPWARNASATSDSPSRAIWRTILRSSLVSRVYRPCL